GHEDHAKAAFADLLQELVRADEAAGLFLKGMMDRRFQLGRRTLEKTVGRFVGLEQPFDPLPQGRVVRARLVEIGGPLGGIVFLKRRDKNRPLTHSVFLQFRDSAAWTSIIRAPSTGKSRQDLCDFWRGLL